MKKLFRNPVDEVALIWIMTHDHAKDLCASQPLADLGAVELDCLID